MTSTETKKRYPILATRTEVLLPGVVVPLEIGRRDSIRAVDHAVAEELPLLAVPQIDPETQNPGVADLHDVGVQVEIVQLARHSKNRYTLVVRTLERVRVDLVNRDSGFFVASPEPFTAIVADEDALPALVSDVRASLAEVLTQQADQPDVVRRNLEDIDEPDDLVDIAAAHLALSRDQLIDLLEEVDIATRLETVNRELKRMLEVLRVKATIRDELTGESSNREHRDQVLRTRMRQIREELGEDDTSSESDELADKIDRAGMPDEVLRAARKQLARLREMAPDGQEAHVAKTYLGWLLDIPWAQKTEDRLDVAAARAILEAEHTGLEKVKKRILEYIAVRKLAPDKHGPILALVGPPGVGKTSLGRSIAAALGRQYVRASLGGVRDESEILGHRRTYVGALPGRIVSGIKKAGSMNPVFVLDEIDKLASGNRGDPASALLEVLDPEQNNEFVDHYLEVPVDLSKVMFVATANRLDTIPAPLRDRMEILHIAGYTSEEKLVIARDHLVPRQIFEHGLERSQLEIDDSAIASIIASYTREAGVRNLERELASLCRSAAVRIAGGVEQVRIDVDDLDELLGPPRFVNEAADQRSEVGVVTGLAWTPTGGDVLFVEARSMPGKGTLQLTGQLGDVMRESAMTAMSYVRANARALDIDPALLESHDIHLHVPSGGVKKDGPSAGVAIATALASNMRELPIPSWIAMTGEITLRGRVLPVGGIKDKVLAAHRAGCRTVILPERNRKDLDEIPSSTRAALDIRFVSTIGEVFDIVFVESPGALDPQLVPVVPAHHVPKEATLSRGM